MRKEKMWVEFEDDAELSKSRKKPGAKSPLTRTRQGELGQVILSEIKEDEEDSDWLPADETDTEPESETSSLVPVAIVGG